MRSAVLPRPLSGLVLAASILAAMAVHPPAQAGPNLLPNPSFELSVFEGSVARGGGMADQPGPAHGTLIQPLLPSGWAFEGSAALFDHTDNRSDVLGTRRDAHSGLRYAAISIPASGRSGECLNQINHCQANPLTPIQENTVAAAYSVNPVWRNAVPVPVTAGQVYTLSVIASGELMTSSGPDNPFGTRAFARVRWLSAGGNLLSLSPEASYAVKDTDTCGQHVLRPVENSFCWRKLERTVTAPAAAAFAVVLLGHSQDTWIGQVMFDDVFFG